MTGEEKRGGGGGGGGGSNKKRRSMHSNYFINHSFFLSFSLARNREGGAFQLYWRLNWSEAYNLFESSFHTGSFISVAIKEAEHSGLER